MSRVLHKILSPYLHFSGRYGRSWSQRAEKTPLTAVLCYHRVVATNDENAGLFNVERGVPADTFEAQLRFMLKHFSPILPSAVADADPDRPLRFAVTFDDGYADNFTVAAPILEKLEVSAAFYVVSDHVGGDQSFWWERLASLLRNTHEQSLAVETVFPAWVRSGAFPASLPLISEDERERVHSRISAVLLGQTLPEINIALIRLSEALRVKVDFGQRQLPLMNWTQLRDLHSRGFEIGAHTRTHAHLGRASEAEMVDEIQGSIRAVEKGVEQPVLSFAYPYGGDEHHNSRAAELVRDAGCRLAFTTRQAMVGRDMPEFHLPRFKLNRRWSFACAYNVQNAVSAMA